MHLLSDVEGSPVVWCPCPTHSPQYQGAAQEVVTEGVVCIRACHRLC